MKKNLDSQDTFPESNYPRLLEAFGRYNAGLLTFGAHMSAETGVTFAERIISDHLQLFGPLTPSDLARRAKLTSGAVTALLDRLESRGFVERRPHPKDRRSVLVHYLPHEGELPLQLLTLFERFDQVVGQLDDDGRAAVLTFLLEIADSFLDVNQ